MIKLLPALRASLVLFVFSLPAHAAETQFNPVQKGPATAYVPLGDTYEREIYDAAGAQALFLGNLWDEDGNYLIAPGSTWTWIWRQEAPFRAQLASVSVEYVGGEDFCWSGLNYCGPLRSITYTILAKCLPAEAHSVELLYNGNSLGTQVFKPTRFEPALQFLNIYEPSIAPTWPAKADDYPAGSTTVGTGVRDSLGCGVVPKDVMVRFQSNVVPRSAGHEHFASAEEIGTGEWTTPLTGVKWDPEGEHTKRTMVDVPVTHEFGRVAVSYRAKEHGVAEIITLTPVRYKEDGTLEKFEPASDLLNIEIPGLERITTADNVVFAYGGGCPHNPPAQFFTPTSYAKMSFVAWKFFEKTGEKLSLNDASLTYGGVIDNGDGGGGRDKKCHVSHRVGIDINNADSAGKLLRDKLKKQLDENGDEVLDENGRNVWVVDEECPTIELNGKPVCRIKIVQSEMDKQGARLYQEALSIHYRFEAPF
ncbi:MAG TPA: hypothetical protein VF275_10805 [Gammaproteobacteria bacterium]